MFGFRWRWSGNKLQEQYAALQTEVSQLKAAATSSPTPSVLSGGNGSDPLFGNSNLAANHEQIHHFRGWQYVAIRAIASRVAGQPVRVGYIPSPPDPGNLMTKGAKQSPAGELQSLLSHPLIDAIDDPNPIMVRWSLLYVTVATLELTGRAFWWFRKNGDRLEIWPLPSHWVTPENEGNRLHARWRVRPPGNPTGFPIDGDDIAYFSFPDPADPVHGSISPLSTQAAAVNLDEAIETAHTAAMRNSARPGMLIRMGEQPSPGGTGTSRIELTETQRDQLIASIRRAYQGVIKTGEPMILDRLIEEVKPFFTGQTDIDWQGGSKLAKSRIFQAFGVHEFIVGETAPSSYAQAAAVERTFVDNVINPLLVLMGQVLTGWMGPKFQGPQGSRLLVWFEPATARDADLEFKYWTLAVTKGHVTPNESRRRVGLPPIKGGDKLPKAPAASSFPQDIERDAAKYLQRAIDPYTLKSLDEKELAISLAEKGSGSSDCTCGGAD